MPIAEQQQSSDSGAIFDLSLPDKDILTLIKEPLAESERYWNDTFGLAEVRKSNMDLWLPNHWNNTDVYDFQEDNLYQDPRIFVSVETICSVVNSRIAQPSVSPGTDSPTSTKLAQDVGSALYAHSTKFQTQDIFRVCVRNLMLKRIAWVKLRFDPSIGQYGEIIPELVLPEDVIVDMDAKWNEIPRFIAQRIRNKTYEELVALFPDAAQNIYKMAGANRKNSSGDLVAYKSQLAKKKIIFEVWFRYFDNGEYKGGLMWVDENFQYVLGKMQNPNWIYDAPKDTIGNILDQPEPPFIPMNYLNDGSSYIDLTSMTEQAATMQKILDRRGFQIMENADQGSGGLVFNTSMITKADISKLTGSPDERVGVKGDVRAAVTRVAPPPLSPIVMEDKLDARAQIDDIYGTHDISRGKESGNHTLGQDKLQVNQDYTRMDDISRTVERSATKYYRYLAQMMKVYYTEEHWFKEKGEDGEFDFIMMKHDLIEDGIDITVEAGSTMPMNKEAQSNFASDLAQLGLIDPLTLYEVGSGSPMPSPKKMLERLMAFKTDPMQYAGMAASDEFNREALMDIQVLNAGEMPEVREEVTPEYLNFFHKYMTTGDYQKAINAKPEIQNNYIKFLMQSQQVAQAALELMQTQLPSPAEMDAQNQKTVMQAGQQQQINAAQPPEPAGKPPLPPQGQAPTEPAPAPPPQ